MRIKVELEKHETIEDAESFMAKSVQLKHECSGEERYADEYLNELESYVCGEHRKVLKRIAEEVTEEIDRNVNL